MIKSAFFRRQLVLIANELLVITLLIFRLLSFQPLQSPDIFPMILISTVLADSIYVGCLNLKNNRILSHFSFLLILVAWYFLMMLERESVFAKVFSVLDPIIFYVTIRFVLAFFFQDSAYKYKKPATLILTLSTVVTICMKFINLRLFALSLLIELILGFCVCIFLFVVHRKRFLFVLKTERKNFIISAFIVSAVFLSYIIFFGKRQEYVGGMGAYLLLFLPLSSIHSITFKNQINSKFNSLLNNKLRLIFYVCFAVFFVAIVLFIKLSILQTFILVHFVLLSILVYFTLLYSCTKTSSEIRENEYTRAIADIEKEENLKKDFSNYLHDNILQDLLSIKNLQRKSDRPEIREMIVETLDNLNTSIREQMQEYHPVILKSLSIKENYQNLIESIKKSYPTAKTDVTFTCDDKLFLIEPYNYIVFRIIKELVNNAFKHAKASHIAVTLKNFDDNIELEVQDNGVGIISEENSNTNLHKGLNSIKEQLFSLDGKITSKPVAPSGTIIKVNIPMKGENSYAYFVSR